MVLATTGIYTLLFVGAASDVYKRKVQHSRARHGWQHCNVPECVVMLPEAALPLPCSKLRLNCQCLTCKQQQLQHGMCGGWVGVREGVRGRGPPGQGGAWVAA